jgi:tetratricopeptide (TPR) repeat protein
VLAGVVVIAGCTGAGQTPRRADIDPAIALFVNGRYQQAIERFDELAGKTQSDETLREVYYYLGRAYLALGQNDRAIDAFAAGVSYGDNGACVDYLERLQAVIGGDVHSMRRSETITRRQLAAALARQFIVEDDETIPGDPDEILRLVTSRGWMQTLPDGALHGNAVVTRSAFLVTLARITAGFGFGRTLLSPFTADLAGRGSEPVGGAEAAATLEELAALRNQYGG